MATLYEYFVKDSSQNLTLHETWKITNPDGSFASEVIAKLHYDFAANAKFVSFYFPASEKVTSPEILALNKLQDVLDWPTKSAAVFAGLRNEMVDGRELVFTGRVFLYSERPMPDELKNRILAEAEPLGHKLIFRSADYVNERNHWEKPRAFVAHDSRDKLEIAQPLAVHLQNLMCPVWYDEFSLKVGDSLRQSIEAGLKECHKCILVLTPNFLGNSGWTKREYDSVFTRELVEKRNVILPVWQGISVQDVYQYSPILADRVAVQWSEGVERVARKLLAAIN